MYLYTCDYEFALVSAYHHSSTVMKCSRLQKRPAYTAKETCIYCKRDLHMGKESNTRGLRTWCTLVYEMQ